MDKKTDAEVAEALEYLAWRERCAGFRDNFISSATTYGVEVLKLEVQSAYSMAHELWWTYAKKGSVGTYQEYVGDPKAALPMLCHAINN